MAIKEATAMEINQFKLESPAFKNSAEIPEDYTCHGKNISPPLKWSHVPEHAKELALICEDPDAPEKAPFIHWVAYHIPANFTELKEGVGHADKEFAQGKNSAGEITYMGPKPPENTGVHRYYFRLFAVDDTLD